MSVKPAAIPLFGDAYLADTRHLTTEEHGAYLLLMMAAWRQDDCSLPLDDKKLARIVGLSQRKWLAIRETILEFWTVESDRIHQSRLRQEWNYVRRKSESNRKSASARWDKQDTENKGSEECDRISERNAPPPPPIEEPIGSSIYPRETAPEPSKSAGENNPADSHVPRSKKRATKADPQPAVEIPAWVPPTEWQAFVDMRKRKGAAPTAHAVKLLIGKLEKLRTAGNDPGRVLDQSTLKNWTDLYELKDDRHDRSRGNPGASSGISGQRDQRDGFARVCDATIFGTGPDGAGQPPGTDRRPDSGPAGRDRELPLARLAGER